MHSRDRVVIVGAGYAGATMASLLDALADVIVIERHESSPGKDPCRLLLINDQMAALGAPTELR